MAKLSTHILDTYHGGPAAGVGWRLEMAAPDGQWTVLREGVSNADGRTDEPLLAGDALRSGRYRIYFAVGAYFRARGLVLPEPNFLDEVVLQVGLQSGQSYHVPLLTSPWSYSTYRGS
jgi:5-hydroxyisourate hydrolase